jgi:Flp pilus assembly protein TadG
MRWNMSPGHGGRGASLMSKNARADKAEMRLLARHARFSGRGERGQGMVEFALLAPLLFMIIVGIIQFAVGLNFWLDMQRVANRAARSAAVNCGVATRPQCGGNLATYVSTQMLSPGNRPSVEICYVPPSDPAPADWSPNVGDDVRVTLRERYQLQAIMRLAAINFMARSTTRLEQQPNLGSSTGPLPDPNSSANYVLAAHTGSAPCQPS